MATSLSCTVQRCKINLHPSSTCLARHSAAQPASTRSNAVLTIQICAALPMPTSFVHIFYIMIFELGKMLLRVSGLDSSTMKFLLHV